MSRSAASSMRTTSAWSECSVRQGRRCQVYATFTGEHDVAGRIERVLRQAGIRVAVLRQSVPSLRRELWYEKQLKEGIEVVICHPKLVETGLDLLWFPTIYFYETGYSLHTLRQASRRSWRIGQMLGVRVKFFIYAATTQLTCLRLMGKKMLVALMMEGKFSGEGIHSMDTDDDMMAAMARELVEKGGVGQSADAIWDELKRERGTHLVLSPRLEEQISEEKFGPSPSLLPALVEANAAGSPALTLMHPNAKSKKKPEPLWPTALVIGEQLSLFN
jgi:hypothetical protein